MTVKALLNDLIDGRYVNAGVTPNEARLALEAIEINGVLVTALRQMVENPGNLEARAHAARAIKLHDDYVLKCTAPKPVDSTAAKNSVENQDVADLV